MSGDDNGGLRNTIYRNTTRSSRRMTWWRRLLYRLAVPLVFGIIRAWFATCRVVRIEGAAHLDEALHPRWYRAIGTSISCTAPDTSSISAPAG
jgi:hypothetical protein